MVVKNLGKSYPLAMLVLTVLFVHYSEQILEYAMGNKLPLWLVGMTY